MVRRVLFCFGVVASVIGLPGTGAAQSASENAGELRAVIILARHGVRAPIGGELREGVFNAQPWPKWTVEPGMLTPHGIDALKRMGEFYVSRYGGLVKGCASVEVESTNTPRTIGSAKAVMSVVAPTCTPEVKTVLTTDPPGMDKSKFNDAVMGRMGNHPEWFTQTYVRPLAAMHDVLTKCEGCRAVPDFRTMMIDESAPSMMQAGTSATSARARVVERDPRRENAVSVGADLAQNFLLQYVEGLPMSEVGWGHVDRAKLDELMEMNTRFHDFMLRTPFWANAAAGGLAKKIAGMLQSASTNDNAPHFVFLSGHDANLGWLSGVLRVHWAVSDEALNATPPGSAMIFELRRDATTNLDTVRVMFVAQTLDQMRNLTSLTGKEGPSVSPIYVPGCSGAGPEYACSVKDFARVVDEATR